MSALTDSRNDVTSISLPDAVRDDCLVKLLAEQVRSLLSNVCKLELTHELLG